LARKPNNQNLIERNLSQNRRSSGGLRQPFWLPASGFYVLSTAIGIIVFFLVWGILHNGEEETPWIPAGVLASCVLVGAVILREIILRQRRNNLLLAQERLDYNLNNVYRQRQNSPDENKLTLEKNAAILKEIARKSEAANVLGNLPEVHWEVFELCEQYLNRSEKELETVRVGSPRLATLNRSVEKIRSLHKFHLLAWSSAESRSLIQEAQASVTISKKLEIAAKALNILDSAIQFYPSEQSLLESANAVNEFIATVKVSHWIEQAERSAFKGNYKRAINHYRDALFYLARQNVRSNERDLIAEKINLEIVKLKEISNEKHHTKPFQE
jgi:tetratricopeptide (TPR) repeat protein